MLSSGLLLSAVSTIVHNIEASSRQDCAEGWRERKKRNVIVMATAKAERQKQQTRLSEKHTVDRFRKQFIRRANLLTV